MAVNYAQFIQPGRNLAVEGLTSAANTMQNLQAQQAAQAQQARAAEFQQAFGAAYQSGDNKALTSLIGQYPEQFEQIKQAAGFKDEQSNNAIGSLGVQIATMAETNPQAAAQLIANNADVLRAKGAGYEPETLMRMLAEDPKGLAKQADTFSLLALGPEAYYKTTGDRAKIDAQVRGQDITMRGQDIQQSEGQANRNNAMTIKQMTIKDKALDREISTLNALAAGETNELKRQELQLKVEDKKRQMEQGKQEMAAKKETTLSNMTEAAQLATELADDPNLGSVVGTVTTMLPTTSGISQDLINKASRLQSLLTVDNLKLMTGVLTERDIAFLTNVASGLNVTEGGIKGSMKGVQERLGKISVKLSENIAKQQPQGSSTAAPVAGIDVLLNKYAPN